MLFVGYIMMECFILTDSTLLECSDLYVLHYDGMISAKWEYAIRMLCQGILQLQACVSTKWSRINSFFSSQILIFHQYSVSKVHFYHTILHYSIRRPQACCALKCNQITGIDLHACMRLFYPYVKLFLCLSRIHFF